MVHHADLEPPLSQHSDENHEEKDRSWILDHEKAIEMNQGYQEWDSDDGSSDDTFVSYLIEEQYDDDDNDDDDFDYDNYEPKSSLYFLGYHPNKEIIFLGCRMVH